MIYNRLKEYCDVFNTQYSVSNAMQISESTGFSEYSNCFQFSIKTKSNAIHFNCEIIDKTTYQRLRGYGTITCYPTCRGKTVSLWAQVSDQRGMGFNLLLLENQESMYGDWFILENTNLGLGSRHRIEPFGFELKELPKELPNIGAMHIYNMKLMPYDEEYMFSFIADRA